MQESDWREFSLPIYLPAVLNTAICVYELHTHTHTRTQNQPGGP